METDLMYSPLIQVMGWTLVHTLWQGLILYLLLSLGLRVLPTMRSNARYAISVGALAIQLLLCAGTFAYLYSQSGAGVTKQVVLQLTPGGVLSPDMKPEVMTLVNSVEAVIPFGVILWLAGFLFLTARLAGGGMYLNRLRNSARTVEQSTRMVVLELSYQLRIRQFVEVFETARIHMPMVVGFIKPVILLPVGLASGLTPTQLETILIHELVHIRRHDYLVNLIQSVIESLLFFNPFVWFISSRIRTEREHCCDDEVVRFKGDPVVYVHALSRIEEMRLSVPALAMPLARRKSELFNRITRIMEKTFTRRPLRESILPIALLIVAVLCMSWITWTPQQTEATAQNKQTVAADTVKQPQKRLPKEKEKKSRQPSSSADAEEIPIPVIPLEEDLVIDFDPILVDVPDFEYTFHLDFDSVPTPPDWEAYNREFEKAFRERFESFHKQHQAELERMMAEVARQMDQNREHLAMAERQVAEEIRRNESRHQEQMEEIRQLQMEKVEEEMKRVEEQMKYIQEQQKQELKRMEEELKDMERDMKAFEEELRIQLEADGYLKKGEKISHMMFQDDGTITINGKSIKEGDKGKYKALKDKHRLGKRPTRDVQ